MIYKVYVNLCGSYVTLGPKTTQSYIVKFEWNVLVTTISWPTDVSSHGGHRETLMKCEMICLVSMKPW